MNKGIMQQFREIEGKTDKLQAMIEGGEEEYEKTHSVCCDARMLNSVCLACKDHTCSQWEYEHPKVEEKN